MADGGNYRESRWFTAYNNQNHHEDDQRVLLPRHLFEQKFGQRYAPFGSNYIQCGDGTSIGIESCEELWTPESTHIDLALQGVDIIGNGSGSHHELRKLDARINLMLNATKKCGGVYLYANQRGCDGGRLYYDGCAMIICNGKVLAQASQFDLADVQVITATIDLEDIRSYRASIPSLGIQAARKESRKQCLSYDNVYLIFAEQENEDEYSDKNRIPTKPLETVKYHSPEEECCLGPACWLWDFLRRSGASGFFLPLSGGADSSAVAAIVGSMCVMLFEYTKANPNSQVANDLRRVCHKVTEDQDGVQQQQKKKWVPESPQEIANYVLHTCFMGSENSSDATKNRAASLALQVGSYHHSLQIDLVVRALLKVFELTIGINKGGRNFSPRFISQGGSMTEDLALQNIQARIRMVLAYLFAQLLPWTRGRKGFLLVLGTANVDEGLRGYMTKYDCSSADLNPIGGISKGDLKRMLLWANQKYSFTVLKDVVDAKPTAELRPMMTNNEGTENTDDHTQTDEEDMGMTYDELGIFGRLRKIELCGPVSMYRKLVVQWSHLQPKIVAEKVKRFFYYYSVNRHKMTTITPAYHAEGYSPDDNRFDLRQFLYNTKWTWQFNIMDQLVERDEKSFVKKDEIKKQFKND
eukprot:CAMPEP_0178957546 /NCGR_PEP_ID=MMETSP0789-20121207/10990_1 /TAXON_ID=3005 /ORGANISM="Rhizosolenia setigera, Strain CCMP 1694" /LENGTH=639 /DNA_ID=CAMNT_0020639839 /DNA_START=498 /DNA_END=2417 /DNA_ORIENTATION=-